MKLTKWQLIKHFTLWGFLLRTEITLWDRMSSVLKFFGSIRLFLIWGIRLNTDFEQIKKEICCWHQFTYLHTYVRVCVGVLYVIIWYQLYCRDTLGIGGLSIDRRPPSKNLWSRRVWTVSHSKRVRICRDGLRFDCGRGRIWYFWNLEEVYSMLKWAQIAFKLVSPSDDEWTRFWDSDSRRCTPLR